MIMSVNTKTQTGFSGYTLAETDASLIRGLYARGAEWVQKRRAYYRTLSELGGLTDRELTDIGISRADIPSVASGAARSRRSSY
jgi:uncharacterized protein YjiS (DUF1127 family)